MSRRGDCYDNAPMGELDIPANRRRECAPARATVLNTGPRVEPAALLHKITELSSYPVPFDEGG